MVDIRVLRVYNNALGKQIGVKVDIAGRILTRLTLRQLRDLVGWGCTPINFDITKSGVQGKECELECLEWLTMDEMRSRQEYRDKRVAVVDGVYVDDCKICPLISGAVLAVVDYEEYGRRFRELLNKGGIFEMMPRTPDLVWIGPGDEDDV